jgi:ComF family protein
MFAGSGHSVNLALHRKSTWRRMLAALGSLLAPPICAICDRAGLSGPVDLCADCLAGLPRPAAEDLVLAGDYALVCCPWSFEYPVDVLVRALKFHGERCHARILGTLLARERARHPTPLPQLVVPVPLHPLRLRTRGYNQAAELASFGALELGLRLDRDALRRVRHTREQSALRSRDRAANVRGAFAATRTLAGASVALVDDVVTTGGTVAAAAEALRAAGAKSVELWVVARALRHAPSGLISPSISPAGSAAARAGNQEP